MNDELSGKLMTKKTNAKPKKYSCLIDDGNKNKKAKATRKCTTKI